MDIRMRLVIYLFYLNQNSRGKYHHSLFRSLYRFVSSFIFHVDLHSDVKVGKNLVIYHGYGLVVNPGVVIGNNVILRHGVTIGNYIKSNGVNSGCPVVEDNVEFGCGTVCVGDIRIGEGSMIGANSVVSKDVPPHTLVSVSSSSIFKNIPKLNIS